jgi:hypothetical protein
MFAGQIRTACREFPISLAVPLVCILRVRKLRPITGPISNRHIKRHHVFVPRPTPHHVRRVILRVLPPLHISNVKDTMDNWAW